MILADHLDLQILARAEMSEDTAFAHLHALGQQTYGQAFQAIASRQFDRCIENRNPCLLALAHDLYAHNLRHAFNRLF